MSWLENGYSCEVYAFRGGLYVKYCYKPSDNTVENREKMFAHFGKTMFDVEYIVSNGPFTPATVGAIYVTYIAGTY